MSINLSYFFVRPVNWNVIKRFEGFLPHFNSFSNGNHLMDFKYKI